MKIYKLLLECERGNFGALEEAGALLWEQIFAQPDSSQAPIEGPVSFSDDQLRELRGKPMTPKSTKPSPVETMARANATTNSFAGSTQKPWMMSRISYQPVEPQIPLRLAQSGQRATNFTSIFDNKVSECSSSIHDSDFHIRNHRPVHQNWRENQYQSPCSIQAAASSMSPLPVTRNTIQAPILPFQETINLAQDPVSDSDYKQTLGSNSAEYDPSMSTLYDPARSRYHTAIEEMTQDQPPSTNSTLQYSTSGRHTITSVSGRRHEYYAPQDPSWIFRHTTTMPSSTTPSRAIYNPSSPPFHQAISPAAQNFYYTSKVAEEKELARIISDIHRSLSNLPDSVEGQRMNSSSTLVTVIAASIVADMPNSE